LEDDRVTSSGENAVAKTLGYPERQGGPKERFTSLDLVCKTIKLKKKSIE
jgi:hypothetical protein